MFLRATLIASLLLAGTAPAVAQDVAGGAPNAVTDWATIVQPAIHSAAAPRSGGTAQLLHTMVMLAVYDAVVAIDGGYEPYARRIQVQRPADVRAAVATAAYLTARSRIAASRYDYLDEQYISYLAAIAEGPAKANGIRAGEEAAAAIIDLRAGDGFDAVVPYFCSAVPTPIGEFEPDTGCPSHPNDQQPADAKVGQIRPFTFSDPARLRTSGPRPLTSYRYTKDFIETRDYGRADSTLRTAGQTDLAYFWSEHPYVYWNRNLVNLAVEKQLGVRDAARFFALVNTATSDAVIAGFAAKYFHTAWRPRTAIPQAALDGNPFTQADATWTPLLKVNHPEYPSGHAFWSGALIDAVGAFFGTDRIRWTLVVSKAAVPNVVTTERTYHDLDAIIREMDDARVWAGLHWRHSMQQGAKIARAVVRHVARHYFQPSRCGRDDERRPCR